MSQTVTLHQIPPSFYSQVARLVLAEKGVAYSKKIAMAGPPLFETYAPWYMRLNPGGTVPTLVHGEVAVADSRQVLSYVDENFEGPSLTPADEAEHDAMTSWIERMYAIPLRELSYGAERLVKIGSRVNAWRVRELRKQARRNPDMRELYEAKLHDIEVFASQAIDSDYIAEVRSAVGRTLDELDACLVERQFVAGARYSLADVVWTVAVARFIMTELDPLTGRSELTKWYGRMKERPSFERADIWEAMKLSAMLPIAMAKLGPRLLLACALLTALGYAAWWLLSLT